MQQQRLGLVVGVVRQCDKVAVLARERGMAQLARGGLDSVFAQRRDVHMFDFQGNFQPGAQSGAKLSPGIGVRADAVVDMQCGKLPREAWRETVKKMEQYDRIHPAAESDQNGAARRDQLFELCGDLIGERRGTARRALILRLP